MSNVPCLGEQSLKCVGVALLVSLMTTDLHAAATPVNATAADISCQLAIPERITRDRPAVLTLTLHNRNAQMLRLLKRNTPFEGWLADSLIVERDGKPVAYSGAMAKRMPPTASEYLRVKPGTSYRYRAPLPGAYDVSLPAAYRVQWRGEVMDAFFGADKTDPEHLKPLTIACDAVSFTRTP